MSENRNLLRDPDGRLPAEQCRIFGHHWHVNTIREPVARLCICCGRLEGDNYDDTSGTPGPHRILEREQWPDQGEG